MGFYGGHMKNFILLFAVIISGLIMTNNALAKDSEAKQIKVDRKPAEVAGRFNDGSAVEAVDVEGGGYAVQIKTKEGKTCYATLGHYVSGGGSGAGGIFCY